VLFLRSGCNETEITTSKTGGRRSGRQFALQSRGFFVEPRSDQTSKRKGNGNTTED